MSEVVSIGIGSLKMTPDEALHGCIRDFDGKKGVIVVMYDEDDDLVIRSSGMTREASLWMLMAAVDEVRNG